MLLKEILGVEVLDKDANVIGKVDDFEFNNETGQIEKLIVSLKKGIISKDEFVIDYDDISTIGDYVLLNVVLPKKVDVEK